MRESYEDREYDDIAPQEGPGGVSGDDAWIALILALAFFLLLHMM